MEPERLIEKCSTIFISTGGRIQVFHSLEEVPEELRERLLESTRSASAATILIADQRGREEILRAAQAPTSEFDRRWAAVMASPPARRAGLLCRARKLWPVALAAALACLFWFVLAWQS
jgi:hypothetical protein